MNEKPLVSIIVPVYNSADYIGRCLDSIVAQTYENLEILIIDDGSKDSSFLICNRYAEQDKRIKVFKQKNAGAGPARNYGIKLSKGKYLAFVDSDDYIKKDMIEHLVSLSEENNADISVCGLIVLSEKESPVPSDNSTTKIDFYGPKEAISKCFMDYQFNNFLGNKLFKKELFKEIKIPIGVFEDMAVMYKLIALSRNIVRSYEKKYFYIQHDNSSINSKEADEERIEYYFFLIDEIISFCKKRNFLTAAENINNESAYMAVYELKRLYKEKKGNSIVADRLYSRTVNNLNGFFKSSKPFYKKMFMFLFCVSFKLLVKVSG